MLQFKSMYYLVDLVEKVFVALRDSAANMIAAFNSPESIFTDNFLGGSTGTGALRNTHKIVTQCQYG